ncbi:MAG TPA: hypothetical protein VKA87_01950 [Nitrososphaeraceae archaeon]|nr:hypothetical protein [Nitrososphaeraceae archaeon]
MVVLREAEVVIVFAGITFYLDKMVHPKKGASDSSIQFTSLNFDTTITAALPIRRSVKTYFFKARAKTAQLV